jgi:hypothetical protein
MTATYLAHARSKLQFLVNEHGFEETNSRESTVERLSYFRNENDDHPGIIICVGFGFEAIPFIAFQLRRGKRAGRTYAVPEYRNEATIPLIAEFEKLKYKKTLDQAYQMWQGGEFDEIFNAVVDQFARILTDNIEDINKGELQEVVNQMKPKKKKKPGGP